MCIYMHVFTEDITCSGYRTEKSALTVLDSTAEQNRHRRLTQPEPVFWNSSSRQEPLLTSTTG